eukprot:g8882.t1
MSRKKQIHSIALNNFILDAKFLVQEHANDGPTRHHLSSNRGVFTFLKGMVDGLNVMFRASYLPLPSHDNALLRWLYIFGTVTSASFFGVVLCVFSAYLGCLIGKFELLKSTVDVAPDVCNWSIYIGVFFGLSWMLGIAVYRFAYKTQEEGWVLSEMETIV